MEWYFTEYHFICMPIKYRWRFNTNAERCACVQPLTHRCASKQGKNMRNTEVVFVWHKTAFISSNPQTKKKTQNENYFHFFHLSLILEREERTQIFSLDLRKSPHPLKSSSTTLQQTDSLGIKKGKHSKRTPYHNLLFRESSYKQHSKESCNFIWSYVQTRMYLKAFYTISRKIS